jgi:carboxyl-terminal processing protease
VSIGGEKFEKIDTAAFRKIVAGSEAHDVELVLVGLDGKERALTVRTAEVVEPTVRHERLIDEARKVGYLAVTSFSHETPDEFEAAIGRLKGDGMRALIVDLRENPGGVLVSAVAMARLFVTSGLIVSTEGRGDPVRYEAEPGTASCAGMPLVVLVDEGTASASEVFAAAVQEHRVGVIVGSPTFGKGMVQTLHRFGDPGPVMKVSTSYYYTPSHTNLEHSADPAKPRGIQPDLHVSITTDERQTLRDRLARPSPSRECQAAIAAWERERGKPVVERIPIDAHISAALDLFAGARPGPEPRRSSP